MNCPRCHASTHADRLQCPECAWELSRVFTPDVVTPHSNGNGHGNIVPISPPASHWAGRGRLEATDDPFYLTAPAQGDWARRPQHKLSRHHHRHTALAPDEAVATLPAGARWQAPPHLEILEMPVVQSSFDFTAADEEAERLAGRASAPVGVRFQAGLFDATLIALAAGVFFALFALLGGPSGIVRRDLLIYLLAAYSLSNFYFGLFTLLGGRTPGMLHHHLRVVNFEGKPPTAHQTRWRAFGYIVSTGSLLLGFFWALLDERRLAWHDHMSQTFVTDRASF